MSCILRDVVAEDLGIFLEHQLDPVACRMAAFTPRDGTAFLAHWTGLLADNSVEKKTILHDGYVAGHVVSFERFDRREIGYWIGREHWGKGIASRALSQFLRHETRRPLFAGVATHNVASVRVLEKCGFALVGKEHGPEVDELLLCLAAGHEAPSFESKARAGSPAPVCAARTAVIVETHEERIRRIVGENVAIVSYDPAWPEAFRREKAHLLACLPEGLLRRIEHFGSTAVPGLAAKPVIDMLAEVTDLEATRSQVVPVLEAQGYDYFWRPTSGDDGPPFYAWFIKRDGAGVRTHHIHMVEDHFAEHWDRLLFRDYLIGHPETARAYETLKRSLASEFPNDRVAYTRGKSEFIVETTERARRSRGSA